MLKLFQLAYIDKFLIKYYFNLVKLYNTPLQKAIFFSNKGQKAIQAKEKLYQTITKLVLMFSIVKTRLDIVFAMFVVSHFAKNPPQQYIKAIKTIMQYFAAIKTLGIIYSEEESSSLIIKNYLDPDY